MPYFQRTRSPLGAPPPSVALERSSPGIVERAVSILDKQLASNRVEGTTTPTMSSAVPASAGTTPEIGDIHRRAHLLLKELLELLLAPDTGVPPELRASAPIPASAPILQSVAAKAGESLTVAVPLANDGPDSANLIFYSTDFVSDGGYEIPSLQVTFSPRTMTLASRARSNTDMRIAVPAQSPPGIYSALVQATGLPAPQAVVVLKVE
jgi:hypothetical protein